MSIKLSDEAFAYLPTHIVFSELTHRAKTLWYHLSIQQDLGENLVCVSTKKMAEEIGCSLSTVRRAFKELLAGKYIFKLKHKAWKYPLYMVGQKRKPNYKRYEALVKRWEKITTRQRAYREDVKARICDLSKPSMELIRRELLKKYVATPNKPSLLAEKAQLVAFEDQLDRVNFRQMIIMERAGYFYEEDNIDSKRIRQSIDNAVLSYDRLSYLYSITWGRQDGPLKQRALDYCRTLYAGLVDDYDMHQISIAYIITDYWLYGHDKEVRSWL